MAITVNKKGTAHAKSLIAAGKINEGSWSFSAADGNTLLGDDNWTEYGKWFLAVDSEADSESKDHFKYPFGKGGEIYRRGVIAAKSRAAQQNSTAVAEAADALLEAIDKKLDKEENSMDLPERRFVPIGRMETREEEDGKLIIEGYPIVYNEYAPLWGFREIIMPGAATEALKTADELVLWDHESSQPMARRSNGSLEAKEDEKGVFIRADVSKTFWGRNGYEAIKNGVIDRMSFAFDLNPDGEQWRVDEVEGVKIETRQIIKFAELYDYSPVSYPAYKQTVVTARSKRKALRGLPQPEASGEDSAAALEVQRDARENLELMRQSISMQ